MTGAALFPSSPLRRRAENRFRIAVAASTVCHLLLAVAMVSDPPDGKTPAEPSPSLTVRLTPAPATVTVAPALPDLENPVAVPQMMKRSPVLDSEPRATAATGSGPVPQDAPVLSLPQIPDSTYYAARDLDAYPRPVVPLELDRIAAGNAASGRVAVALQIDEQGLVNNVEFAEPAAPDRLKEELRAILAATRFLPARKDGRAVRSRVVLSVDFAQQTRER